MKKAVKITVWILAAILILLLGLVVAVQSPRVQTALARKAATILADKIEILDSPAAEELKEEVRRFVETWLQG